MPHTADVVMSDALLSTRPLTAMCKCIHADIGPTLDHWCCLAPQTEAVYTPLPSPSPYHLIGFLDGYLAGKDSRGLLRDETAARQPWIWRY